ncbi:hypothetical protein RCF27_19655 [Rhodococcus pyridinivorans]|uniref:hypothetical protein n=1 Tax=Rhodococcus pyridinivorans TaxID=103816 RepID=UPI00280A9CC7|nr:hypothetical protein [Rhodococcus pyridinivorans]WMM72056.1 hypothetical protein RCF27_19655 [Rhodococcus pyridinivorans]
MTSPRTGRRSRRTLVLALAASMTLCANPLTAAAQDLEPTEPTPPGEVAFPTRNLGLGPNIEFRGNSDVVTLTFPVPAGNTPAFLDTTAELPTNVARGWIDVVSDGRLLTRVELPPGSAIVPLSIPLAGAKVENGAAVVSLDLHLVAVDNICPDDWTLGSVRLRDGLVRYAGTPAAPQAVADYLPPVLDRLELYLAEDPTDAEAGVALDLAATVSARYPGRQVPVDVRELPANGLPPAADTPLVRQIVVSEGDQTGAEVVPVPDGPPALYVRGDAQTLLDQVGLVNSILSGLAVGSDVAVGTFDVPPILAPDSTTLYDLRVSDLETSGLGLADVHLFLDQTEFGRPVRDVRIDLQGTYTPLPATQGGSITVSVGDIMLDSWAADASGVIDRVVTVPNSALGRLTDISVELRTTGAQQQCGLQQPVTLRIDGGSRVFSTLADPPLPVGFPSLPQTLMPKVDVATSDRSLVDVARAVELVAGLQSLTSRPLDPAWVTIDEALASSGPAVIVAANGLLPEDLQSQLPLVRTEDRRFEVRNADGESTSLTFGTELDFASLQVVRDDGRTVLVATSTGAPEELDRTLDWLAAEPGRWFELEGSVLFTAPDREPITLIDPHTRDDDVDAASSESDSTVTAVVVAGIVLLVVGAAGAAVWSLTRRRRPQSR